MITFLVGALLFFILMVIAAFVIGVATLLPGWLVILGFIFLDYKIFMAIKNRKKK